MAELKRLALFLDGTWNTTNDNTNVWRLKSLCTQSAAQKVYYSAGVGTQKGEKVTGGAFGIGINEEVIAAYEWLSENYEQDAKIFIFGFSRGAFTARSLAGFVAKCGLLKPGSPVSMTQLYDRYRKGTATSILTLQHAQQGLSLEDRWLKKYSLPIPVWFQGVWDTVGTLGVPLPCVPHVSRHDFDFLETDLHISQTHAYHALAIDEHREAFKPTLWSKVTPTAAGAAAGPGPRDFAHVEQRWFVGAHANVGGGYPNDLIAQAPLKWLMGKSAQHELEFKTTVDLDEGVNTCPVRDSLAEMAHGIYEVLTFGKHYYRPIGEDPKETGSGTVSVINESIDASVFVRWKAISTYRPRNLQEWADRLKVDVGTLSESVTTADPAVVVAD